MVDALPAACPAMGRLKRPPAAGVHAASGSICARQNYNRPSAKCWPITGILAQQQESGRPNMNEINVISPYKYHGMWVFDDPRVGLVQEPFVAGADTWIDRVVAEVPDADRGFTLIFSSSAFPGHQY
jgi:hypothetical protein